MHQFWKKGRTSGCFPDNCINLKLRKTEKKVFWPWEGKRFTSKVRVNNNSTDILTGLGADMVSTITPALVELLANTLNSLEWEFSDFGQLVDRKISLLRSTFSLRRHEIKLIVLEQCSYLQDDLPMILILWPANV